MFFMMDSFNSFSINYVTASLFLYHCQLYLVTRNPYLPIICCNGYEIYMIYYIFIHKKIYSNAGTKLVKMIMIALIRRQPLWLGDRFTYFLSPKISKYPYFLSHFIFIHITTYIYSLMHIQNPIKALALLCTNKVKKYFHFIKKYLPFAKRSPAPLFFISVYSTQDEQW